MVNCFLLCLFFTFNKLSAYRLNLASNVLRDSSSTSQQGASDLPVKEELSMPPDEAKRAEFGIRVEGYIELSSDEEAS